MIQKPNIKTYTFIDGDFSMDINVSIEQRNVYLNQKEIIELLDISQPTASRLLSQIRKSQMGQVATYIQKMNITSDKYSYYYSLEIIKEIGQKYNSERIQKLEEWLEQIIIENSQDVVEDNFEIVRYNQDNLNISVRYDKVTNQPWLTQKEISMLYGTTKQSVGQHIKNIFEDKELDKNSVVKNYFTTGIDGKTYENNRFIFDFTHVTNIAFKTSEAMLFRRCY